MATIRYNISAGIAPFTVSITPAVHAPQNHSALGNYYFTNIPDNNYTISVTDSVGCNISFNVSVQCDTTTTTTPVATTTSTTPIATTTTTTHADLPALKVCLDNALIFEDTLSFTPQNFTPVQTITEDNNYIFIAFADSYESAYKHTILYRYDKTFETSSYKRITTTNSYCCDTHKVPYIFITSTGALLLAIERLPSNSNHNGVVEIFRWSDVTDLDTYSNTSIGNTSTERLAYPEIYEIGGNIIIDVRRYSTKPPYRMYYKSNDDGISFGAGTQYLDYSDLDYWAYGGYVANIKKNTTTYIMQHPLYNTTVNAFQYGTYLKTNFNNFYALDNTDLGTTLTKAEIEGNAFWGDVVKNSNCYIVSCAKLFGDYIFMIGFIGTGSWYGENITQIQITRTNKNTGNTITGNVISNVFANYNDFELFNICDDIYAVSVYQGDVYYYRIAQDINSIELVYREEGNFYSTQLVDKYCELQGLWDTVENKIKVYRFSDPDIVWDFTTTTSTTGLPISTTTSTTLEPTTTTTTTEYIDLCDDILSLWELDEEAGATAYDALGNYDGSISGATIDQAGKIGKCYSFDGSNDRVSIGNVYAFERTDAFSISVWIKTSTTNWGEIISKLDSASPYRGYSIIKMNSTNSNKVQVFINNTFVTNYININSSTTGINSNTWRHIVVTYDGSSDANGIKLYIDGNSDDFDIIDNNLNSTIVSNADLSIGSRNNAAQFFPGLIDQPAIFNKVLSENEVLYLYNSGNGIAYTDWNCKTTTTTT